MISDVPKQKLALAVAKLARVSLVKLKKADLLEKTAQIFGVNEQSDYCERILYGKKDIPQLWRRTIAARTGIANYDNLSPFEFGKQCGFEGSEIMSFIYGIEPTQCNRLIPELLKDLVASEAGFAACLCGEYHTYAFLSSDPSQVQVTKCKIDTFGSSSLLRFTETFRNRKRRLEEQNIHAAGFVSVASPCALMVGSYTNVRSDAYSTLLHFGVDRTAQTNEMHGLILCTPRLATRPTAIRTSFYRTGLPSHDLDEGLYTRGDLVRQRPELAEVVERLSNQGAAALVQGWTPLESVVARKRMRVSPKRPRAGAGS